MQCVSISALVSILGTHSDKPYDTKQKVMTTTMCPLVMDAWLTTFDFHRKEKARSDFLSSPGICTRIGRRLADAEEIFRDVGTARWHFVAPATSFQPFYPDLRFFGSGGSGSRNRYYPLLLQQIEILPQPQHLTGPGFTQIRRSRN